VFQNKKPGGSLRCSRTKNLAAHSGAPEQKTRRLSQELQTPLLSKTVIFVHDEYRLLITLLEHMNEPPG
jgi:hypothetical protein